MTTNPATEFTVRIPESAMSALDALMEKLMDEDPELTVDDALDAIFLTGILHGQEEEENTQCVSLEPPTEGI